MNTRKSTIVLVLILVIVMIGPWAGTAAAKKVWDGIVQAPLRTAQTEDWSAPDEFFTGDECGNIRYSRTNDTFEGVLKLNGFKQDGPYVLTVDTADGDTLAGYDCDIWNPWAQLYGETFLGGTNGCWDGSPYADVKLFYLDQYDSDGDGDIDNEDYYRGTVPFDVPLLNGVYNLKFFVKLDWTLTSPDANIMMMNNMDGDRWNGRVVGPNKEFNYDEDLIIENGMAAEKLVLADQAWCVPTCAPPSEDAGYIGTSGVVFYSKLADTFRGAVVLSNPVTPPSPQLLQVKLEGMGSLSEDSLSNENLGYIGRWWDNDASANISDAQYEIVKDVHDVLGYVIFDYLDPATASLEFALDSSYHDVHWGSEPGRPLPGDVVMTAGDYKAYFALTEELLWWRGVFLSENPLEFTIVH